LACTIAQELRLPEDQINGIAIAAAIHDIGKIAIPSELLSKPGEINEYEYGIIKAHPEVAYDILKEIQFPWPLADIVLQHHERWDGNGYPKGLKGHEILLGARIISVADVVEAMVSHRPYRVALGQEKAIEELKRQRGQAYDGNVVNACISSLRKGFTFD
jgi:HD-GYP domain-containing protein (c-di-GMP phosphodiesterase class II)